MTVSSASLLYAALSVGFSMMVNSWIFFRISSGLFNPAITFGMVVEGSLGWKKGVVIAGAQFAGGMAAGGLVSGLFPGQMRAETLLGDGTSIVRGLCEYCCENESEMDFADSAFSHRAAAHSGIRLLGVHAGHREAQGLPSTTSPYT